METYFLWTTFCKDLLSVCFHVALPLFRQLDDLVVYDCAQQLEALDVELLLVHAVLLVQLRRLRRDPARQQQKQQDQTAVKVIHAPNKKY